jgi:inner membrane protein
MDTNRDVSRLEMIQQQLAESVILKLLIIGFLIMALLAPAFMIVQLIAERQARRDEVIRDVGSKWGHPQRLAGPILSIPYTEGYVDVDKKPLILRKVLNTLPEELHITGDLQPEVRYRGIYEVMVYTARVTVAGRFRLPDAQETPSTTGNFEWEDMTLSLGIADLKGIKEQLAVQWGGASFPVEPGHALRSVLDNGVNTRVSWQPDLQGREIPFSFTFDLKGSDAFQVLPAGKITSVALTSTWAHPSFIGEFLPEEREVTRQGFRAAWRIFHFNRNIPQRWWDDQVAIKEADFGVKFLLPLDEYQKNTRTAKYAILVIALTFAAFFITEMVGRERVHPVQYLLIGLALCIFYVLLLSLSEQIGFGWAYLLSSLAVVSLITWYARSGFTQRRYATAIGSVLAALYGYLYFILQLEDYALLAGSVGLFVIMAIIMYFTRNIRWYGEQRTEVQAK